MLWVVYYNKKIRMTKYEFSDAFKQQISVKQLPFNKKKTKKTKIKFVFLWHLHMLG